jgi:hypothetical protein
MSEQATEVVTATEFWWLPPWPVNADIHKVVRHFLCHNPLYRGLSDAEAKAYFLGFQQAFDAASTEDLTSDLAWQWYRDMREAIAECVSGDDGEHTTA